MAMKEDFPGWGDMLKHGNGTFFEDWQCRGSGLHSSYLYIGSWFIEALGGIRRPEAGYKEFSIEPWITKGGPKQVRSYYNSLYGKIVSDWTLEAGVLKMEITIPANTTASCYFKGRRNCMERGGRSQPVFTKKECSITCIAVRYL